MQIVKSLALALCASLLVGCNSLAEKPKSVVENSSFIQPFRSEQIANLKVSVAPVRVSYKAGRFDEPPVIGPGISYEALTGPVNSDEKDPEAPAEQQLDTLLAYDPPLLKPELEGYESDLKAVLEILFEKDPEFLGEVAEYENMVKQGRAQDVAALCRLAEVRGSQLLMTTEILSNRMSYKGMTKGGWTVDLALVFAFFPLPFHCWVQNEYFDYERRVRIRCYDVRDPKNVVYDTVVKGNIYEGLHEFQHGYVLFNSIRAIWDTTERFDKENWQQVHTLLTPHVKTNLQKNMLLEFGTRFGGILKTPTISRRLESGDPSQARLYAIVVGVNNGTAQFAENDAKNFYKFLQSRSDMKDSYGKLFTGAVKPKDLIKHIESLATKEVDRVVFYFAGQGRQENTGRQELILNSSQFVTLDDLGEAFSKLKASNVAFILDTSFGDPKRGEGKRAGKSKGGRTAIGSAARLPKEKKSFHLKGLQKKSSWRVMCAAPHDGVTGEYQGQGILTGLLLKKLNSANSEMGMNAVHDSIADRFSKRSRGQFGVPYSIQYKAVGLKREFSLVTKEKTRQPAKKVNETKSQ